MSTRAPIETRVTIVSNPGDLAVVVAAGTGVVATGEIIADVVVTAGTGVPGVVVGIVAGTVILCVVGGEEVCAWLS